MNSEVALNKQNLLKQFEEANSFSESQHLYAGLIQAKKMTTYLHSLSPCNIIGRFQ